jgi:hypothetical protein
MAPILAPLLGILFSWGNIPLKNWSYSPLRKSATPFKRTCLLIRLKEVPNMATECVNIPVRTCLWKSNQFEYHAEVRI